MPASVCTATSAWIGSSGRISLDQPPSGALAKQRHRHDLADLHRAHSHVGTPLLVSAPLTVGGSDGMSQLEKAHRRKSRERALAAPSIYRDCRGAPLARTPALAIKRDRMSRPAAVRDPAPPATNHGFDSGRSKEFHREDRNHAVPACRRPYRSPASADYARHCAGTSDQGHPDHAPGRDRPLQHPAAAV